MRPASPQRANIWSNIAVGVLNSREGSASGSKIGRHLAHIPWVTVPLAIVAGGIEGPFCFAIDDKLDGVQRGMRITLLSLLVEAGKMSDFACLAVEFAVSGQAVHTGTIHMHGSSYNATPQCPHCPGQVYILLRLCVSKSSYARVKPAVLLTHVSFAFRSAKGSKSHRGGGYDDAPAADEVDQVQPTLRSMDRRQYEAR